MYTDREKGGEGEKEGERDGGRLTLSCDAQNLSFHRFLVKCQVVSLLRVALANEHHVTGPW